ncbi:VOC family protein [Cohnella yongneupensis]|uniref:VOC family protein n=1 Tax=Cohnella yongneupensis TaxID=425006 RepID=A0ABW0QZF4_9BACL
MYSKEFLERMDYIQISVTNLEQSIKWYCENFGFKQDFKNDDLSVLFPPNDFPPVGLPTLLLNNAGRNPNWFVDNKGNKHAMHGLHTKKINELFEYCQEKKIECSKVMDEGFAYFMELYDPDNNMFSIIELKK